MKYTQTYTPETSTYTVAKIYGTDEIEIPKTHKVIDFRPPKVNDFFWSRTLGHGIDVSAMNFDAPRLILEKVKMKQIIFTQIDSDRRAEAGEFWMDDPQYRRGNLKFYIGPSSDPHEIYTVETKEI